MASVTPQRNLPSLFLEEVAQPAVNSCLQWEHTLHILPVLCVDSSEHRKHFTRNPLP